MAYGFKLELDLDGEGGKKIRSMFDRLEDPKPVLLDMGEYKRRRIVQSMPTMPRNQRSTPGLPPARRTGLLAQRITYDTSESSLDVGTNDERAALLQFGGTVRPKTAKALTVPVHDDAQGKRPRDFSNLTYIPRKNKPPLLVREVERGKSGVVKRMDVMFVLLKSVTIKPRPFLVWHEEDRNYLEGALLKEFEEAGN